MATDKSFSEYALERLGNLRAFTCKKMFGEYLIYCDGKPFLLICDNDVFFKITPTSKKLLGDAETGYPYQGAKLHYKIDIDDSELVEKLIQSF